MSEGKWYDIKCSIKGEIDGKYQEFPTDDEYYEYLREIKKEN